MSIEDTRSLIARYVEQVWNRADLAALEALTLPTFVYYLGGQPARDREAFGRLIRSTHEAFPDWRVETLALIVEADRAAVRWSGMVTHGGPFRGIPPTGRRISVTGINLYELSEGRIAAEWEQTDSLGMLQQLGVLPPG
jgi:steroid delta-isomerase-like uncharacterized protein